MITLELLPDTIVKPVYLGTVHHANHGVAMALNWDFKCTLPVRRYHCGLEPPNYPMPAIRRRVVMHVDNNGKCHAVSVGYRFYPVKEWPSYSH